MSKKGIVYDDAAVARILGLPVECSDPAPEATCGEIVVYYGGWTLAALQRAGTENASLWVHNASYYRERKMPEAGYYRLLFPVVGSNRKSFDEQVGHLKQSAPEFQPASVCIAATALLVRLKETGDRRFNDVWCRCAERMPHHFKTTIAVYKDRLVVNDYAEGNRVDGLYLAASQKC